MTEVTILEALQSEVDYPIPAAFFAKTLMQRNLKGGDQFTAEVGESRSYRLAYADCLKRHITTVNISEPGISLSLQDRDKLVAIANAIYSEYGEPLVQLESVATVEYLGEGWG